MLVEFGDGSGGRAALEAQFRDQLHPDVRTVVLELARWSEMEGLPPPRVLQVGRTEQAQVDRYVPYGRRVLAGLRNRCVLSERERKDALQLVERISRQPGHSDDSHITLWALTRASWHRCWCAADLVLGEERGARARVLEWLRRRMALDAAPAGGPRWELLAPDASPFGCSSEPAKQEVLHLARRDFSWRSRWPMAKPGDLGALGVLIPGVGVESGGGVSKWPHPRGQGGEEQAPETGPGKARKAPSCFSGANPGGQDTPFPPTGSLTPGNGL